MTTDNTSIDMGINFADVPEKVVMAAGKYRLRIISAKVKENGGISLVHEVVGHSEAANVFHNLSMPSSKDDATKKENKVRFIRGYMSLFGVPMNGSNINVNDFVGCEADATLGLKERMDKDDDGAYSVPTGVFDNVIKVSAK